MSAYRDQMYCLPRATRKVVGFYVACMCLVILGLAAIPVRAQLLTYVNEKGKLVYTNDSSPTSTHALSGPAGSPSAQTGALSTLPPEKLDAIVRQSADKNH